MLGQTWGTPHASLMVESRIDEGVVARLRAAGHDVEVLAEPYADQMGHAGAVLLHSDGTLGGAHDPRADGGAAGL
jgi:gamma-glutamyltranspeptidase/glutathione hydrolase